MKYVLDSSVAFKWLVPEMDTDKALRILDDFQNGIHELLAPDILALEVTHALTRAERQGRVASAQGSQLFIDLMNQLPPLHPHLPLLPAANAMSSSNNGSFRQRKGESPGAVAARTVACRWPPW